MLQKGSAGRTRTQKKKVSTSRVYVCVGDELDMPEALALLSENVIMLKILLFKTLRITYNCRWKHA